MTFKNGDLVRLSFRGKLSLQMSNIANKVGIVTDADLGYGCSLVLVRWFSTGGTSETHVDFIELLGEK